MKLSDATAIVINDLNCLYTGLLLKAPAVASDLFELLLRDAVGTELVIAATAAREFPRRRPAAAREPCRSRFRDDGTRRRRDRPAAISSPFQACCRSREGRRSRSRLRSRRHERSRDRSSRSEPSSPTPRRG